MELVDDHVVPPVAGVLSSMRRVRYVVSLSVQVYLLWTTTLLLAAAQVDSARVGPVATLPFPQS